MFELKKIEKIMVRIVLITTLIVLAGCRSSNQTVSGNQNQSSDTIKIAFYPNESAAEFEPAREAVKAVVEKATDKKVELVTSTDYYDAFFWRYDRCIEDEKSFVVFKLCFTRSVSRSNRTN